VPSPVAAARYSAANVFFAAVAAVIGDQPPSLRILGMKKQPLTYLAS